MKLDYLHKNTYRVFRKLALTLINVRMALVLIPTVLYTLVNFMIHVCLYFAIGMSQFSPFFHFFSTPFCSQHTIWTLSSYYLCFSPSPLFFNCHQDVDFVSMQIQFKTTDCHQRRGDCQREKKRKKRVNLRGKNPHIFPYILILKDGVNQATQIPPANLSHLLRGDKRIPKVNSLHNERTCTMYSSTPVLSRYEGIIGRNAISIWLLQTLSQYFCCFLFKKNKVDSICLVLLFQNPPSC